MNNAERAVATFKEGYCCAQAVLGTFAESLGLERSTALRLAESFCAGIAYTGETCGAVSGALMVIGLKYGRAYARDEDAKQTTRTRVRDFLEAFTAHFDSTRCKDILGCHIGTPEGLAEAEEKNLFETLCPDLIRVAVELLEPRLKD